MNKFLVGFLIVMLTWVTILTIALGLAFKRIETIEGETETRRVRVNEWYTTWKKDQVADSLRRAYWDRNNIREDSLRNEVIRISKETKALQNQLKQQSVLMWMPTIPDLSSEVATFIFWIATSIVGGLVTAIVVLWKFQMDFLKSTLPLFSELKTFLQLNLKK